MSVDFAFVSGVFHSLYDIGLERVSFLEEFVHAFGICAFAVGQSLEVSRLSAGAGSLAFASESCRVYDRVTCRGGSSWGREFFSGRFSSLPRALASLLVSSFSWLVSS